MNQVSAPSGIPATASGCANQSLPQGQVSGSSTSGSTPDTILYAGAACAIVAGSLIGTALLAHLSQTTRVHARAYSESPVVTTERTAADTALASSPSSVDNQTTVAENDRLSTIIDAYSSNHENAIGKLTDGIRTAPDLGTIEWFHDLNFFLHSGSGPSSLKKSLEEALERLKSTADAPPEYIFRDHQAEIATILAAPEERQIPYFTDLFAKAHSEDEDGLHIGLASRIYNKFFRGHVSEDVHYIAAGTAKHFNIDLR